MAKADDEKMYNLVCKDRFDEIDNNLKEILSLLRGHNNNPGVLEDIRTLKSRWKMIFGGFLIIITALVSQAARWIYGKF